MAVWFLVPGFRFLHLAPREGCVALPAFHPPLLFHDVRFDQLAPSSSPSCQPAAAHLGSLWQPRTERSAVVAAASGQPSGMAPSFHLISSWFLLPSSPPSRALQQQGRASSSSSQRVSPLPTFHRNPSFRVNGRIAADHTPTLPCCHLGSLEVGHCDGFGLSRRPTMLRVPENRRCTHTRALLCRQPGQLGRPVSAL